MPDTDISKIEVTNISQHGFWVLLNDREEFLAFDDFPWFRDAPVRSILNVELPQSNHLYWPELDIDLSLASIENLERFPLKSKP